MSCQGTHRTAMAELSGEIRNRIAAIRASGLFEEAEYEFRAEAALQRQDPVYHYLSSGEARGGRPSRRFDPDYYKSKHGIKGDSPLVHYLLFGRQMGLRALPAAAEFTFGECGFRAGYRRVLFLAPHLTDTAATAAMIRLLHETRNAVDSILLFLDPEPFTAAFEDVAACVASPVRAFERGWDTDPVEAAYVAAEIMDRYAPAAAICCGIRGRDLVARLAAKFVPTVTLTLDNVASEQERLRYRLYRHSAAILFATEAIRSSHASCYPWIASRKTAVLPLLSPDPADVAVAAQGLVSALADAEALFKELSAKHQRIARSNIAQKPIAARILRPDEFKSRLRENCIVGGLATGGTPDFPVPRILVGFDARNFAKRRKLSGGNPVIEYLLEDRFEEFLRPVIGPQLAGSPPTSFRAALHGHYYYTDVAEELLIALASNRHPPDLYLSTDTEAKADHLSALLRKHATKAEIRVFPNKGRDLGPLLTGFRDLFDAGYDVIGHVHGKKSAHVSPGFGDSWRRHLLEHTVGGTHPMMDAIIAAFATNERLGLVFPEDDQVVGWDRNLASARSLACRMNIGEDLEIPHFDFPAGSFFWCRTELLKPMTALELDWNDYPDEPLPHDGTILHALERLPVFVCEAAGYEYATVHVPGLRR